MLEPIQAQPLGLLVLLATSAFRFTSRSVGSFNIVGFPIYDTHGNMVATIARYGTNSYQLNNLRSYDAWGVIRYGALSGDPKNRYCAASGHQCDDESGLIYMRARYYDASSGRLISEDPKHSGANWFAYCNSCPTDRIDPSGKDDLAEFLTSEGLSSELEELGVGTLDGTIDQVGSEING